jgi:YHS domain-containing protein
VSGILSTVGDALGNAFQMLLVDLAFSAIGAVPSVRPSVESITDRGIHFNYTAVLNILFTLVGAALVWLTIKHGARDPVCGMHVDRNKALTTEHGSHNYYFCSEHCRQRFQVDPEEFVGSGALRPEPSLSIEPDPRP